MSENQTGINFGASMGNFNPADLQVTDIIQTGFAIDESGSIEDYEKDYTEAVKSAVDRWQKSHHSDKILYSEIRFSTKIRTLHGYQPVTDINSIEPVTAKSMTSLFAAAHELIHSAIEYRKNVEQTGGEVKTMLFIFTDGQDNTSMREYSISARDVKKLLTDYFKKDEGAKNSFEVFLFGIGEENFDYFKQAAQDMGVKMLWADPKDPAFAGKTPGEIIRAQVTVVSQSVSSGSTANLQNLTI